MPSASEIAALADLGGFGLFLFVIVVAAVGLWRQWWVPGWLYRASEKAREIAETQALRNSEAIDKQAAQSKRIAAAIERLAQVVARDGVGGRGSGGPHA